jgi:hypothetical protein
LTVFTKDNAAGLENIGPLFLYTKTTGCAGGSKKL